MAMKTIARTRPASRSLLYPQIVFALVAGMLNVPLDLLGQWITGSAAPGVIRYCEFHLVNAGIFAAITFVVWRWIVPRLHGVLVLRILVQVMLGVVLFGNGMLIAFHLWTRFAHIPPDVAEGYALSPGLVNLVVIAGATLYLILGGLALDSASQEQRRLRELALTAQLEALRSQLNHHFLFNSLNVIAEAAAVEPARAEKLILQLAGVLRYSMGRSRAKMAPLSDELAAVASYLELERARSGDRISVHTEIASDVREIHVPPLLIQPLVENAVAHGLLNGTCAGTISIAAWRGGDRLHIRVEDNGVGFQPKRAGERKSDGVGLANLRDRLRAFYGEHGEFHLHSFVGGGTVAEISLALTGRNDSARPNRGIIWNAFFGYIGSVVPIAVFAVALVGYGASAAQSLLAGEVADLVYLLAASAAEETRTFDLAIVIFFFVGQVAYLGGAIDRFTAYAPAWMFASCAAVAILPQLFGAEPFTGYWMRHAYPAWIQKSPSFARITGHLAAMWALGFAIVAAAAYRAPADTRWLAILAAVVLVAVLAPLSKAYPAIYIHRIGLGTGTAETFILGLPFIFDRKRANQISLAVQFVVSGAEPGSYYVEIRDGRCLSSQGDLREPDLTIYCGTESWTLVSRGELSAERAVKENLLRFRGAADDFRSFFRCFRLTEDAGAAPARGASGLRAAAGQDA
ncbi:MAG: histidine kinase [Candidatus Binataceae bacterium]